MRKEKRPLMMNRFFDVGRVVRATICGNARVPGVAGSFDVALVGVVVRVTCGLFLARCELSRRFPGPSARGPSHAASSGRFVRSYSRPRWSRPINGLPSSFPDFYRKYDLTWIEQQDSGRLAGCGVHRMVAVPFPEPVQCDRDGGLFRRATKGPARTGGAKSSEDVRVTR
jgi:hypothetical protein